MFVYGPVMQIWEVTYWRQIDVLIAREFFGWRYPRFLDDGLVEIRTDTGQWIEVPRYSSERAPAEALLKELERMPEGVTVEELDGGWRVAGPRMQVQGSTFARAVGLYTLLSRNIELPDGPCSEAVNWMDPDTGTRKSVFCTSPDWEDLFAEIA